MRTMIPTLRTQSELLARLRVLMRDPTGTNQRWSNVEIYEALNDVLNYWVNRVEVPRYYTFSLVSGTYEYTLPDYVVGRVQLQAKRTLWGLNTSSLDDSLDEEWDDVPGYVIEPNATGGQTLRIESIPASVDARIFWYGFNSVLPAVDTLPTLNADISTTTATSLVLDDNDYIVGRVGYVKVDDEWMAYSGVTDDGTNQTLTNLLRGVFGSTAATHSSGATVTWGVAAFRDDLWMNMENHAMSRLHRYFLTDGSPTEKENHQRMVGYYDKLVEDYWKRFTPLSSPQMRLSGRGIGPRVSNGKLFYRLHVRP